LIGGGFLINKFFNSVINLSPPKENHILKGPGSASSRKTVSLEKLAIKETEKELSFHDCEDDYKIFVIGKD